MAAVYRPLGPEWHRDILKLLRAVNFPKVSHLDAVALDRLAEAENWGILQNGKVVFWTGFFNRSGRRFMDTAVLPDYRCKWATKENLRKIYHAMFKSADTAVVYAYSLTPAGRRCALSAGFVVTYDETGNLLALTREAAQLKARVKDNG